METADQHQEYEETSYTVDPSSYDALGFAKSYTLRRHKYEAEANRGAYECRQDWIKYIGPIEQFGNCNPYDGNFTYLVLPFTRPERLWLCAYIHEYAFLYDNVLESAKKASLDSDGEHLGLRDAGPDPRDKGTVVGSKQIQSKIILELLRTEKECAERVLDAWKTMVVTTNEQKEDKPFDNIEDYVQFRIVDTGAPYA